jgi:hypothetical protein
MGASTCRARLAIASFVLALASGCSARDVVVARDEPAEEAGVPESGGEGGPHLCVGQGDCSADEYCAKSSCGSAQGQCQLRPATCDDTQRFMCGCDGVVYWNDCLRQRDGVAASTPGQCVAEFSRCESAGNCPVPDAVCGKLLPGGPDPCPPAVMGVCWVLPDACPADAGGPPWETCGPPPSRCTDLCSALRSQQAYKRGFHPSCP